MLTAITFYSNGRLGPVIYRAARNKKQKIQENSNSNKLFLGCPIKSHNMSRRSKLKTDESRKFKRC